MKNLLALASVVMIISVGMIFLYYLAMAGQCQDIEKKLGVFVFEESLNNCMNPKHWMQYAK